MAEMTRAAKPYRGNSDDNYRNVGAVNQRTKKVIVLDVVIGDADNDETAEYVITVNGRPLKRMTHFQAKRMGLTAELY